jgi:hypothetical protein
MSFSVRTETNPKGQGGPPTTPRQHAKSLQKTETRQLGNRAVSGPSTAGATDFSRRSEHRSVSDLLQATRLKTHVRSKTHHFSDLTLYVSSARLTREFPTGLQTATVTTVDPLTSPGMFLSSFYIISPCYSLRCNCILCVQRDALSVDFRFPK